MKEKTAELVIRIVLVIIDWANAILKDKRKDKGNDGKGNSEKKQKGKTTKGNPGGS